LAQDYEDGVGEICISDEKAFNSGKFQKPDNS
jgi:hypothetical protein